jgi:hypothetical protein
MPTAEQDLLTEIRDHWKIDDQEWTDIRQEGDIDIQCLTGGLWKAMDPNGAKQRKDANRPMIELDELNQYCNQVINDLRANKRGIKVSPKGNGATDQTALFRQGKIRDTEYRSNAHQAYTTLAENMIQRSYGWLKIEAEFVTNTAEDFSIFDQELVIRPVPNPNMITPGAHAVSSDGKDLTRLWERESRGIEEFKREFKGAKVRGFTSEELRLAPQWIKGQNIDIAKYWVKRSAGKRTRLALKPTDPNAQPLLVWKDDLKKVHKGEIPSDQILKSREVESFTVCNYLTNGFEVLEKNEWPGQSIPFVSGYGKVIYVTEGGQTKRKMLSLVRLARSPQMLLAYLATCEAELVGMTPKFPYFFWDGSLTPEALELLARSLHEPVAGIPVKIPQNANAPATFPQRQPYEPPIQALEILKESVRRSIQAAIGASPLPTQAQRHNEKSGVALKQIEDTAQKGSFHFVDHYDEAIARTGDILNENIGFFYDTARETSIRTKNDDPAVVRINDPQQADAQGQPLPHVQANQDAGLESHIPVETGDHDVTISVGPRQDSEREASSDFADTLLGSKAMEFVAPPQRAKLLAATVKLKNLGPIGDEIAEILDPQDKSDPAQAMQQLQALHGQMQEMGQALQQLTMEKHAKVLELKSREQIAEADRLQRADDAQKDRALKLAIAHISASKDSDDSARESQEERLALGTELAVDAAKTGAEHAQEIRMAQLAHRQGLEAGAAAHDQNLEAGAAGHQQQLEQGAQAAALAPEPAQPEAGA